MINITVILNNVPHWLHSTLVEDLIDIQKGYSMTADACINTSNGYVCIDIESKHTLLSAALGNTVDMLDDSGLGPYITEIGVD